MKKIECSKCGKNITANNYKKHYQSCDKEKKPFLEINEEWNKNDNYECPYCGKEYSKSGIISHIWRSHTERGLNHKTGTKGKIAWNKGLTKETDNRVKKNGETLKDRIKNGIIIPSFSGKTHNEQTKEKISEKLSKNNNGGKCKWFDYVKKDGSVVKLQGTWEVRFARILDIIDEEWIKIGVGHKEHSFIWDDGNRKHYYTPDFYSKRLDKYFETKGYWWGEDEKKMEQVILQNPNVNIEIIRKKELEAYEKLIK